MTDKINKRYNYLRSKGSDRNLSLEQRLAIRKELSHIRSLKRKMKYQLG